MEEASTVIQSDMKAHMDQQTKLLQAILAQLQSLNTHMESLERCHSRPPKESGSSSPLPSTTALKA